MSLKNKYNNDELKSQVKNELIETQYNESVIEELDYL